MPRPFNMSDGQMTPEKVCRHEVKQVVTDLNSNNIDWALCSCCFHPFSLKHDTNASPLLGEADMRALPAHCWGPDFWTAVDELPKEQRDAMRTQFCGRCNESGKVNTFAHWGSSYFPPGQPHVFSDNDLRPIKKVVKYWKVYDSASYEDHNQDWRLLEYEAWATTDPDYLYDVQNGSYLNGPFIKVNEHSGNYLKKKDAEAKRQQNMNYFIEQERERLAALEKKVGKKLKAVR